ncbi:MAG: sodium-dependent bicarbonate transport family permease [Hydrogenophaga sp.]|nr:sodium-dependent bicarbonate transport family permease [Hydrogenophaga sp.]
MPQLVAVILLGILQTLIAFVCLRSAFGFDRQNAAATAAHYGSVSVATFAVAVSWFASRGIEVEPQMAAILAVMEIPAILVGIVLARGIDKNTDWKALSHEAFLGKGVTLLLGGMAWRSAGRLGRTASSPSAVCTSICSRLCWRCSCWRWA